MQTRVRIAIGGTVQGVGFRPFVYRLAVELSLAGWVRNDARGLLIEAEGEPAQLSALRQQIEQEHPPHAVIDEMTSVECAPRGARGFQIRVSEQDGARTAEALPDLALCADCRRDIMDPADRRYRYPFTACTQCGPRYSMMESLPFDRGRTSMGRFVMCRDCRREYDDPANRRFHAQAIACHACGPTLHCWEGDGRVRSSADGALRDAVQAIREGCIIAVKGLGGFHLMADACHGGAVAALRRRKHRDAKPFALMFPSLAMVNTECCVNAVEQSLLLSSEAPIVLLHRHNADAAWDIRRSPLGIAPAVAPGSPCLGVMLPYTPLHHLLLSDLAGPVVATSGNRADEPICTDEGEALTRLKGIADLFLIHDRPIVRHLDDSIVRVVAGGAVVLRRARGFVPRGVSLVMPSLPLLTVGGQLKNVVALSMGHRVILSQHIGDLERQETYQTFEHVLEEMQTHSLVEPATIGCDLHPDYRSTVYARSTGKRVTPVQHHHAHVASCMAEHGLRGTVLGVAWDGTGYGPDGTIWGGEFLLADEATFHRVATLRPFRLPGNSAAVREPRRVAIGLLFELWQGALFEREELGPVRALSLQERRVIRRMLEGEVNSPLTSSVGRLFDGVASLVGLRQRASYEGQAAMELEWAAEGETTDATYTFRMSDCGPDPKSPLVIDWAPMLLELLDDLDQKQSVALIAGKFHNSLASMIVDVARWVGQPRVVLTGGCFQNRYLTERAIEALSHAQFHPYWHQTVPTNDGGLALGQAYVAAARSALAVPVHEGARC